MKHFVVILFVFFGFVSKGQIAPLPMVNLNYVAAIPDAPIGFSFMIIPVESRYSFYCDLKFGPSFTKGEDYTGTISIKEAESAFNDTYLGEKNGGTVVFDLGIGFAIIENKRLNTYLALGFKSRNYYKQYYDATKILSPSGYYHIKIPSKSFNSPNITFGIIGNPCEKLTLQLGYDFNGFYNSINAGIGFII